MRGPSKQASAANLPLPDKPSIAVLPFENMSGDPEQEYFADGISEDIITALSRSHWFFVIARNSSFSFKGTSTDVRQVAQELGVRYVLEGSVRKSGKRVRITAQLIDATTGNHVWANRYDRELDDIFAIQDEITEAIAGEVGPSFVAAEAKRAARKAPENLDAWDFAMRGNWHLWRFSREDFSNAKLMFRKAIALDPDSSNAQSGLALACQLEAGAGWADNLAESREEGFRAARRAVALDDQNAWAHLALAWVNHVSQDNEAALNECRKALDLNPNLASAEGLMGLNHAHLGHYDDALLHVENAMRQSPRDSGIGFWILARVIAALAAGRNEDYLEHAKVLTEAAPDFTAGWRHLAVAYVLFERIDEAQAAIHQVLRLSPEDGLELIRRSTPIVLPKARETYFDGLRKAGLPE